MSKQTGDYVTFKFQPLLRRHRLLKGLDKNLSFLAEKIEERVSAANHKQVLDLIEKSRTLKNERNENVHGVWNVMVHANTGAFAKVARSRYEKDKAGNLIWDIRTPTLNELDKLALELQAISTELNAKMAKLWDEDDDVVQWRCQSGF